MRFLTFCYVRAVHQVVYMNAASFAAFSLGDVGKKIKNLRDKIYFGVAELQLSIIVVMERCVRKWRIPADDWHP